MAVIRQLNILGQMRLDVPHIRSIESSIAADFDLLAGKIMAGQQPLIVRGFDLSGANGDSATTLKVNVAGSILMHPMASEAGTIFAVDDNALPETLEPTNDSVLGSFVPDQVNFIGIDLRREADDTTTDTVMFLDANTRVETPRSIPLARTLSYKIVISTADFSATPHICPVAKVTLNQLANVSAIVDCRPMAFRLGSGGSVPNGQNSYTWPQGRTADQQNTFTGGDKDIGSEKDWRDAIMTRLWELGGGERWYSPTSDRDTKLAFGTPTFEDGKNFAWSAGKLSWKSLSVIFANSTATKNDIQDNLTGKTLDNGQCLYVDIDRTTEKQVTAVVGDLSTLGTSTVPGSRFIIAWRKGNDVFARDYPFEVTRDLSRIPAHNGSNPAKALFQGTTPGELVWRQVEPFVTDTDAGYVLFDNGNGMAGSDKFFWDREEKRLGIGNSAPTTTLDVTGAGKFSSSLEASSITATDGVVYIGSSNLNWHIDNTSPDDETADPKLSFRLGASEKVAIGSNGLSITAATGDAALTIEADPANADESAGPYILMKQDGGAVQSILGHSYLNAGTVYNSIGEPLLGGNDNALFVGTKTAYDLQLGANNKAIITVGTNGTVKLGVSNSTDGRLGVYPGTDKVLLRSESSTAATKELILQGAPIKFLGDIDSNINCTGTVSGSYLEAANNITSFASLQKNAYITFSQGDVDYSGWNPNGNPGSGSWQMYDEWRGSDPRWSNNTTEMLVFKYYSDYYGVWNGVKAYIIAQNADDVKLNFTGQHRVLSETIQKPEAADLTGLIVVAAGMYCNVGKIVSAKQGVTINESLPNIALSSSPYSKNVFGVISDAEDPESGSREHSFGNFVSVTNKSSDDSRIIVNSIGEGAVWVCNANGALANGDYITTSEVPGLGMKQDSEFLANYTVAKITMDCDFDPKNGEYEVVEFEHNGKKYKKAFVGCTYHCG